MLRWVLHISISFKYVTTDHIYNKIQIGLIMIRLTNKTQRERKEKGQYNVIQNIKLIDLY